MPGIRTDIPARFAHHSRREIRDYDRGIRQSIGILLPERTGAAAELEHRAHIGELELIEYPSIEAVTIDAEARVERGAFAEIAGVLVLLLERRSDGFGWTSVLHAIAHYRIARGGNQQQSLSTYRPFN